MDIAKQANVSTSTVCRALQNSLDIGEETKNNIRKIANDLDYKPNLLARSLRLMKSNVIGIIITDNTNPYFATLLKGIEETARAKGYIVFVINTNERNEDEREAIATLRASNVAGILAVPVKIENYYNVQEPLILLSRGNFKEGDKHFNYIIDDDIEGAYLATSHLLDKGLNNIYYIGGIKSSIVTRRRLEGYKRALNDRGIRFDENKVIFENLSMQDGFKAFTSISFLDVPPIGVFCNSDFVAIGAMRAIKESGWTIPCDVSIIGYDDIDIVSYMDIPLTTVRQAEFDMGKWGTEILIDRINNKYESVDSFQKVLRPELIVRKTT